MNKKIAVILSAVLMLTMMGCASQDSMTAGQQGVETSAGQQEQGAETSTGQQGAETEAVETVSAETAQVETAPAESAAEGGGETYGSGDITVIFTNDVHCAVSENIGYDGLSAYKKEMESKGGPVFLVDDGDELQGGTIGTLTKGEAIINIMNDVGYDVAAPGNHDFDYGLDTYMELAKKADFDYVCSNITDLRTGELIFPPYVIKEAGGKKIGI
ncbi:MAG: metallophosphoesterase, partial [Lachnospiraceae bacterium]|nr:metallophosphoesterase [Lachnospiraceae bacterium]